MRILILGLVLCNSVLSINHAQEIEQAEMDYHLVYVELSSNNNRMGLVNEINRLLNSISAKGDPFICFLSNAENGILFQGSDKIEELFYLIGDLNTALPNVEYDLRNITEHWNNYDITFLDKNNITHHKYRNLNIHYFVSPSFYNLSAGYFSSKLLKINNINELNNNTAQVHQLFYFNSDDTEDGFLEHIERDFQEGFENSVERIFLTYN